MKNILASVLISLFLYLNSPTYISAEVLVVSSSAELNIDQENNIKDYRVKKLTEFLESKNSPLSMYAEVFIAEADRNNIDWRLVAAISGVESSFGKRIPLNSYNAYGWANGKYQFSSWEQSIAVVSQTLSTKYYDKGATNINKIAKRYAPPSTTWGAKVKFFMNKIDPIPTKFDL